MTFSYLIHFSGAHRQIMHRPWRLVVGTVTALALLSACGNNGRAAGPGEAGGMPAMPVTVIEVNPQQVPVIIEVAGQTEGSKDIEVRARVTGVLTKQLFQEGDKVKKGDALFSIDRAPFEIALAQARAALAQDKANLEKAQREATRLKPLVDEKAVSQKEADDANSGLLTAQASLAANEARVRDAELNLSYTRITAPISGVTGRAGFSEGTLIIPGAASSLLTTLHIIDPIWVRFGFSEREALQLRRAGSKSEVKLLLSDGSTYDMAGKLNFTASTVNSNTGMVQMRAEFPNPKAMLLPGQFVRVQVAIGEREAYLVPQAAMTQTDQGKLLFTVAADNTVAPRPVETDGWSGHDWVVSKGLAPGDKIITDNLMKLRPGAAVMPHAPGEGPGAPAGAGNAPAADKPAQTK
ncbi:MAG: membrane fusion protein [Gammaproteobacteria bacterium]|nr:MAG: membrane fusion protein [Gammaproteobacteria bacterium]TND06665.1 MAG: membrane fusion protein [Gammaproteobacteria bacterium]